MEIIEFKRDELVKCYEFSKSIILSNNQYNRFFKNKITQIQRTFVGKLGEYSFLLYLKERGINYPEDGMFEIFEGKTNVDLFDFKTPSGKLIDVKVASKPFHSRIMIPVDQFHLKKDYYVGIKLDFQTDKNRNLIINSVKQAQIYGYCFREELEKSEIKNFGEGACKSIALKNLRNIENIMSLFKKI